MKSGSKGLVVVTSEGSKQRRRAHCVPSLEARKVVRINATIKEACAIPIAQKRNQWFPYALKRCNFNALPMCCLAFTMLQSAIVFFLFFFKMGKTTSKGRTPHEKYLAFIVILWLCSLEQGKSFPKYSLVSACPN